MRGALLREDTVHSEPPYNSSRRTRRRIGYAREASRTKPRSPHDMVPGLYLDALHWASEQIAA